MADREKVFDALRNCVTEPKCKDCPWEDCEKIGCKRTKVPVTLLLDALTVLKEQQETIASLQGTINKLTKALAEKPEIVRCKDCKHWDKTTREEGNDCISGPWEDAECEVFRDWDSYGDLGEHFRRTNGDWFCADGERR